MLESSFDWIKIRKVYNVILNYWHFGDCGLAMENKLTEATAANAYANIGVADEKCWPGRHCC